jgi:hypothetical protein
MLILEEFSRTEKKSPQIKWIYLFDEKLPNIQFS